MNPNFSYLVKTSKKARGLRISVKSNGQVVITKPWLVPHIVAEQFLKSHQEWVLAQLSKLKFVDNNNDKYLYQGILYDIVFNKNKFSYIFSINKLSLAGPNKDLALKALEKIHIKEASVLIRNMVKKISSKMGIDYGKITIRDQDSRWGSCSSKGNLNFSWRLIKTPQEVLEYVIIHELAHIKHMDHSKQFWELVELFDPLYREHRRWLRRNQGLMK